MARRKNVLDDIKKELECPVCQEQFSETNELKVLKCQHTFCKSCLDSWLRQQGERRLSCPNCRVITECPNQNINRLPTSLAYKNLGDILKDHSNKGAQYFGPQDEHVCRRHNERVKFYCEQCDACICSECAIVEHRDWNHHTIVSLEEGARKQKAIIESKLRDVETKTSRSRVYIASLKEKRRKFGSNIEKAASDVHRVAEYYINMITQYEESVTELLAKDKSLYDEAFSKELSTLVDELLIMDDLSAHSREVLQRNNLTEMLCAKQLLDEMTAEKCQNFTPVLRYPHYKYTPNAIPLKFSLGKLYVTYTEPSLSIVTGIGLTEGIEGEENNFTVITKDSNGQTTCSEIDKVHVEIKCTNSGTKTIAAVVTDLKDGRYSISYTPNVAGEFRVSIKVRDNPVKGSPFKLLVAAKPKPAFRTFREVILPNNWIPQPKDLQGVEQIVHLVQLDPVKDAQEFQDVSHQFHLTCGNQIVKIERVQNPALYRTYTFRKEKMDTKDKCSSEQRLFLGNPGNKCQEINKTGFCIRLNNTKATTMYGNGLYFAKDASYSAFPTLSPPDGKGYRYMHLARVLVGEYTVGRQDLVTPPAKKPGDLKETYDSVVDQIPNPTVFVIFYEGQFYPEYLITFC